MSTEKQEKRVKSVKLTGYDIGNLTVFLSGKIEGADKLPLKRARHIILSDLAAQQQIIVKTIQELQEEYVVKGEDGKPLRMEVRKSDGTLADNSNAPLQLKDGYREAEHKLLSESVDIYLTTNNTEAWKRASEILSYFEGATTPNDEALMFNLEDILKKI